MKILIKENAPQIYLHSLGHYGVPNWDWVKMLRQVKGQVLEVETEYLFKDQFNTVPIPGVSENGMRIGDELVQEVFEDERDGLGRCNYCGKTVPAGNSCPFCKQEGYVENF